MPNRAESERLNVLGVRHLQAGDVGQGIALLRAAIAADPDWVDPIFNLGLHFAQRGPAEQAEPLLRRALELEPTHRKALTWHGLVLNALGKSEQAIGRFEQALAADPGAQRALWGYALALLNEKRFAEAEVAAASGARQHPTDASFQVIRGIALFSAGRLSEAADAYEAAIARKPGAADAHTNLIYTLSFGNLVPQSVILEKCSRFERDCLGGTGADPLPPRAIDAAGPIKIGILSADLGNHPIVYFLESYLRHFDRARFSVTLFPTTFRPGADRDRLLALASAVHDITGVPDDRARKTIMDAGIDILIDTTGYMTGGRLALLARRCAPLQGHYIGFHGSLGLRAMDFFIADAAIVPPENDSHFSEQIVRLPRTWVAYAPPADLPGIVPRDPREPLVFGSFNNLAKVREQCLAIWASVLRAHPGSRLLLKDRLAADPKVRERIVAGLAAGGVEMGRVSFRSHVADWQAHMAAYNEMDLALDTYPLNSGTTAFDALAMGVPLVALRGAEMASRLAASILQGLGRPDWAADSVDDLVATVRALTAERSRLAALKPQVRAQFMGGELTDGVGLTRALEAAFLGLVSAYNPGQGSPAAARLR